MFKEIRNIRKKNTSPHARLILIMLLLEKCLWIKFPFRMFRVIIAQGIYHVELDPKSFDIEGIGSLRMPHPYNIIVHGDTKVGHRCTLFHNVTIGAREGKNHKMGVPVIGDGVFVGSGSSVIGDVVVGNNVCIGAMSLVLKSVNSGTITGLFK